MDSTKLLIETVRKIKTRNQFKRYIDFIHFPFYRNFEINSRISFDFPLTVLIGQNGCGKSSCLHALYGAPEGNTPYRFWFSTKVDPIEYFDDKRRRHSFWYTFVDEDAKIKEVLKARIKRPNDPDYWETSRPLVWAGMKRRRKGDRDKPINKNVVYLDFRSELSAFDKFFYFGNLKNSYSRNKQEFIRGKSASLHNLFSKKKKYINSSTRKLNDPLEELSKDEIKWISYILNRAYKSGLSVLHELYRNEGYSILFETDFAKYSEAYAGSGEMAIVRLVHEVLNAEDYSLILLDEPEVSLHPGAQSRLKIFLLEQIKLKKHQIILTSHSPSIVEGLPKEAIKVLYQNPRNGRFLIKENLTSKEAFYYIEYPVDNKKKIIVEDILAKQILDGVLSEIGEETRNLFHITYNPGGESVIKKEFIPVYCRESFSNTFIFFDGDQKPENEVPDWRLFSTANLNEEYLQEQVKIITDVEVKFSVDGGDGDSREDQKIELFKKYLDYYKTNVFFLPNKIPEDIIWQKSFAKSLIELNQTDPIIVAEEMNHLSTLDSKKDKFAHISNLVLGDSDSENISNIHKMFLRNWLNKKKESYQAIESAIHQIIEKVN
jgi:predicted ATPase